MRWVTATHFRKCGKKAAGFAFAPPLNQTKERARNQHVMSRIQTKQGQYNHGAPTVPWKCKQAKHQGGCISHSAGTPLHTTYFHGLLEGRPALVEVFYGYAHYSAHQKE